MRRNERTNAELAHSFPSSDSQATDGSPGQREWQYRVWLIVARRAANEERIWPSDTGRSRKTGPSLVNSYGDWKLKDNIRAKLLGW
jgi:hypothetical protein